MSDPPVPPYGYPPAEPSPAPGRKLLVPLLIGGGVLGLLVAVLAGLFIVGTVTQANERNAEDTAVQWVEVFDDHDARAAYDLIAPAQRRLLPYEQWESCGFESLMSYENEGVIVSDVSVLQTEGPYIDEVPGDGERQYQATDVTVRVEFSYGDFDDYTYNIVKDGGNHYIRLGSDQAYELGLRGMESDVRPPGECAPGG